MTRAPQVGDRIQVTGTTMVRDGCDGYKRIQFDGVLIVIDDDAAGVKWDNGLRDWLPLSSLTLADSEGGK